MPENEKEKLLQSVKRDISSTENSTSDGFSYFIIGLFCAVFILVIIVIGLGRSKENKLLSLDETYKTEVTEPLKALSNEQKASDNAIDQIDILTAALSKRIKYSLLMTDIVSKQFKKSVWQSFTLKKDTVSILGSADSYDDVAKSIAALRSLKAVQDVSLKAASKDENSSKINFTAQLKLDLKSYQYSSQAAVSATPSASTEVQQ